MLPVRAAVSYKSANAVACLRISCGDWTRFRVGSPSTRSNWTEPSCQPLESVSHVTHIHHALDIFRDGRVAPQLIWDESRLNTDRILVTWLSPNDWVFGSRYGNIAFELDWSRLADGKRLYWIGAMNYSPMACRILITDKDHDGELKVYDPTVGNGPWWWDRSSNVHYWNGNLCLEFMFESQIALDDVESLRFVNHHQFQCSISPTTCPDRNLDGQRGGARLLAGACAAGVLQPSLWLDGDNVPTRALTSAWNELRPLLSIATITERGSLVASSPAAIPLARSILTAISKWQRSDSRELIALFEENDCVVETCASLIETTLNVPANTMRRTESDESSF
jgi:hypothetical protein